MENSISTLMIKLVASNYSIWKPMMEDLLYCKDLYEVIELKGKKTWKDRDWRVEKIK